MNLRKIAVELASILLYLTGFIVLVIVQFGLDPLLSIAAPLYIGGAIVVGLIGLVLWDLLFTPILVRFLG